MCGISGIVAQNSRKLDRNIAEMVNSLKHRGPDEKGVLFFDNCVLGHTRLSIVDLNVGSQPMLSVDRKKAIVFNGEIYGYKDIKRGMHDYSFRTTSDTEVILALYEKHGKDMMSKLPGMFSFSIWDEKKQELFCARDRFGEKPFFYAVGKNNEFIFASEIKSILVSDFIEPVIDKESLRHYLKKLYIHPSKTIYKNIFVLPPAHFLVFNNGRVRVERYWSFPQQNEKIELADAVGEFRRLFEGAIKKHMVADVPVGAFLSGGLDSSTVVAIASRYNNIKTFSFGFDDETNELRYAREIAKKYHTDHIELLEKDLDLGKLILDMQGVYDEPFADSSNIPTFLISKLASQHVKTVLTGDGGDELLGGYDYWYKELYFLEKLIKNNLFFPEKSIFFVKALKKLSLGHKGVFKYLQKGMELRPKYSSVLQAHCARDDFFTSGELVSMGIGSLIENSYDNKYLNSTLSDVFLSDVSSFLPGDILTKIDRASMANGLETRSPFLDIDLASFCISLPTRLKVSASSDKIILRKSYGDLWTSNIKIRKKQGFGADVKRWFEVRDVQSLKKEYLENKNRKIYDFLSYDSCVDHVKLNDYKTWILLNLSLWLESHNFITD